MNKTIFAFSIISALALGVVGCGDSSSNGGTGGTGGTPTNMAMVWINVCFHPCNFTISGASEAKGKYMNPDKAIANTYLFPSETDVPTANPIVNPRKQKRDSPALINMQPSVSNQHVPK